MKTIFYLPAFLEYYTISGQAFYPIRVVIWFLISEKKNIRVINFLNYINIENCVPAYYPRFKGLMQGAQKIPMNEIQSISIVL